MANIPPLGPGGDAPMNLDSLKMNIDSTSTPWTSLPSLVHNLLGSKMNVEDLRAMRNVCSNWRHNVEQYVGLNVKVDDSLEGNLEFVGRIQVGSARIIKWTVDIGTEPANHLFQSPDWLMKLDLCEKMPAQWKIHNLSQFPNLSHLVLRHRVLSSNNLTGHQYPVFTFDPTSPLSLDDALKKAYETQEPPSEDQPIVLKSLKILKILGYGYYRNATTIPLPTHSGLVRKANLCFILGHIKAPLLSFLNLEMIGSIPTLRTFLDNHRSSLRQLLLSCLASRLLIEQEATLSNSFPSNLSKLKLQIEGPFRDLDSGVSDQSTFICLEKILDAQNHLEDVFFVFPSFPVKWISDAFTALANSCFRTLRYLELYTTPNQRNGILDLEMLSVCERLEVLHMPWWGRANMTFRNVEKLPRTLKRLIIDQGESAYVDIGDPNVFKRLTALEWVQLYGIRFRTTSTTSGNQMSEQQFCTNMFQGLLGLRKLEGFQLEFYGIGLNRDPTLVKMLRPLDPRSDIALRHRYTRANFNFTWVLYDGRYPAPWSDKPFDNEKDMEPRPVARVAENLNGANQAILGEGEDMVASDDEDESDDFEDEEEDDINSSEEDRDDLDDDDD